VRYRQIEVNLHRFWDTDVIELADESPARYARRLASAGGSRAGGDAALWAAESLMLRRTVYAGVAADGAPSALSDTYAATARMITERRLREAGHRLAATLNRLLCG